MPVSQVAEGEDGILSARIVGEYLEMPGLNITVRQACRLWGLDEPCCTRMLDTLRASGFLRKVGDRYVRADSGSWAA